MNNYGVSHVWQTDDGTVEFVAVKTSYELSAICDGCGRSTKTGYRIWVNTGNGLNTLEPSGAWSCRLDCAINNASNS